MHKSKQFRRAITFGTFDLLHVGHVRILQRAAALADELVVGVSSDDFSKSKKGKVPVYPEGERMEIIKALRCVDEVFLEESFEEKPNYIRRWHADCLVMGDDWAGKFDGLVAGCETLYLPRTEAISTTGIETHIRTRSRLP